MGMKFINQGLLCGIPSQPPVSGLLWQNTQPSREHGSSSKIGKHAANGLKYYDLEEGGGLGDPVQKGDSVTVHYDCLLGKVNVASSRYSALLLKNEVVPEPFSFTAGKPVGERRARKAEGGMAGGNFIGAGGPKPPPALSTSVIGMKKGGKRSVIVTPDQAYGDQGYEEVPGGATIELLIEVLDYKTA